jgi:hypothetical protein
MLPTYTFPSGSQVIELGLNYAEGVRANIGGTASLVFVFEPTNYN